MGMSITLLCKLMPTGLTRRHDWPSSHIHEKKWCGQNLTPTDHFTSERVYHTYIPGLHQALSSILQREEKLIASGAAIDPGQAFIRTHTSVTAMPPKHERPSDRGSGRGRGRGAGGRNNSDPSRRISHALSWVLRHQALELGLPITKDGYVPVSLILNHSHNRLKGMTLESIQTVVATNDKQRFKLEEKTIADFEGKVQLDEPILCIRANQGHSIPGIDAHALLQPLTPSELAEIPTIVHGTFADAWNTIQKKGLSKMGRNHIHFASGMIGEDGVISGMRKSCQVYIYVNAVKCAEDGIKFFKSDNGVLLTAGLNEEGCLPVSYFSHVTDKSGNVLLDHRPAH